MSVPVLDEDLRVQICAWLTANDIDPADVPFDVKMTLGERRVSMPIHQRNAAGRKYLTPAGDDVATEQARFVIAVPPDGRVLDWLRAGCPSLWRDQ